MSGEMNRHCRWLSPAAATDLAHRFPAALVVHHLDTVEYWCVVPLTDGGYAVREELPDGSTRLLGVIDPSFGGELRHWECSCRDFRPFPGRRCEHGCRHVRVVHAAMERIGLT